MKLIGLTGAAGAGKDTVADCLQMEFDYSRLSFAEPMKQMAAMLGAPNPTTREEKEGPHPVLKTVTWRQIYQEIGTELVRKWNPDAWVLIMQARLQLLGLTPRVVISDVRFENEAAWIRSRGGQIWHIVRPDVQKVREHVSEAGIQPIPEDQFIYNTSSIEALHMLVRIMVDE